jgi:hypothetical protein
MPPGADQQGNVVMLVLVEYAEIEGNVVQKIRLG